MNTTKIFKKIDTLNLLEENKTYEEKSNINIKKSENKIIFNYYRQGFIRSAIIIDDNFIEIIDDNLINILLKLLDKLDKYSKINSKEDMLFFCNKYGKYIDKKYYNLNNVEDCFEYFKDFNNNYCEKFFYFSKSIDYYDEDYIPEFYLENIGKKMFLNEDFWFLISQNQTPNYDNYSFIYDLTMSNFFKL